MTKKRNRILKSRKYYGMEELYCIQSLKILSSKKYKNVKLPFTREFASMASDNGRLIKILDNIENEPKKWEHILDENAIGEIPFLRDLFKAVEKGSVEKDRQTIQKTPISKNKIESFINETLSKFNDKATFRNILKGYELFINNISILPENNLQRLMFINQLDHKAAFFDNWYIEYSNWGQSYGEELAIKENWFIFNEISKLCNKEHINDLEQILSRQKGLSDIIIITFDNGLYNYFTKSKKYSSRWKGKSITPKIKGYEGSYLFENKKIPVFCLYHNANFNDILILNKKKLGNLIQYSPLNEEEHDERQQDILSFNIQSFSDNKKLLNSFLETPPKWLSEIGGTNVQIDYLIELVLIKLFERFEFTPDENFEGYLLNFHK